MIDPKIMQLAAQMGKPMEGVPFEEAGHALGIMMAMFFHALKDPDDSAIDTGIDAIATDAKTHYRALKPFAKQMDLRRDN